MNVIMKRKSEAQILKNAVKNALPFISLLDLPADFLLVWKAFPSAQGQSYGSLKVPNRYFRLIPQQLQQIYLERGHGTCQTPMWS
ncbi:hypothetical protein TSAR_013536 [Trichomalopsis sarcophagae]|uniref:Uncharacterized protein n=1 Tax=Trichomalopsis sarcophagae TaxID=543379 RepID=A0A232EF86_9HYME|nr:hypothetical protein TSAR_013536 [Trichomalopsis sarcophagae]